jgi:hypothetical protein
MAKLTLSIDEKIISRARRFAQRNNTSVSSIVEDYLASKTSQRGDAPQIPILDSVRGILKSGSRGQYRRYLAAKYR